ncbi:MAG: glycoside hydrolase family 57 protein, partial [Alistipes sp.]|nr:glycoside hydrolase family 57 protein [Alistipes sp.]
MKTICLYFQVHQPWRLKNYRFFNMGKDHNYLDDLSNRAIMQKIARQCYLPMNALLLKTIKEQNGKFRCSFSITGTAVEQFRAYAPEVLDSFRELAATGCVEFLAETYSHSLAALASKEDFTDQVKRHVALMKSEFGVKPAAFRNTELIYSDEIGAMVAELGFKTMLAEGARHILGWKSPNFVYANAIDQKLRLLLRNYKLSDDIAFRFSDRGWDQYPLTAAKYVSWLTSDENPGEVVNLFMDYETFGEHQHADTGIFEFMKELPKAALATSQIEFATVSEGAKKYQPVSVLHCPHVMSWADEERDITA